MKIAILTHPLWTNYGGILQAYALQTYLQRYGHDVIVINREYRDYPSIPKFIRQLGSAVKSFIRVYILQKKQYVVMNPLSCHYHSMWRGYDVLPFVKKYILHSSELRNSKALRKYLKLNSFDCFVVGSDQVWRPPYVANVTDYFLKEVPENSTAIKIAYAASFGVDKWEFSSVLTDECAYLAKKFNSISVREKSGVRLCKEFLGVEAQHLLDPTMLLNVEDYECLINSSETKASDGNLFCYILDENRELSSVVESVCENGFKPIKAAIYAEPTRQNPRPYQMSVEQWLRSFKDADLVITDSFHACVFSILFKKPFIAWVNKDRGSARFESLLAMFGLEDRLINSLDEFNNRKIFLLDRADLDAVDKTLNSLRRKTDSFFAKEGLI